MNKALFAGVVIVSLILVIVVLFNRPAVNPYKPCAELGGSCQASVCGGSTPATLQETTSGKGYAMGCEPAQTFCCAAGIA